MPQECSLTKDGQKWVDKHPSSLPLMSWFWGVLHRACQRAYRDSYPQHWPVYQHTLYWLSFLPYLTSLLRFRRSPLKKLQLAAEASVLESALEGPRTETSVHCWIHLQMMIVKRTAPRSAEKQTRNLLWRCLRLSHRNRSWFRLFLERCYVRRLCLFLMSCLACISHNNGYC